ncbi:MAG: hypothetical protein CSA82_02680 [Actinobacteria bacterium]|nr:MAG: hypothetical protein CSA82_02680 [Actinomycetota bacterium]
MVMRSMKASQVTREALTPALDEIRRELRIPVEFPDDALEQAETACQQWDEYLSELPSSLRNRARREAQTYKELRTLEPLPAVDPKKKWDCLDLNALPAADGTHIPFVTIDPEGARDLDQAIHLHKLSEEERAQCDADSMGTAAGAAYLVSYAIASVATFVPAGSPLDRETQRRGLTTYLPDHSTPLHPPVLSEGAASLLPDQYVPAVVWQFVLDEDGQVVGGGLNRCVVRSRAQLTYRQIQDAVDTADTKLPSVVPAQLPGLLKEIGVLRLKLEDQRGGVSARIPSQEIVRASGSGDDAGHLQLQYRAGIPAEEWNAQISLMTGMEAAALMRWRGMGILRVMPEADARSLSRLRGVAKALDIDWPHDVSYAQMVRSLDPQVPAHAAFLLEALTLYRGAGYVVYGIGAAPEFPDPMEEGTRHSAIAAEYTHVTAPLRRLVDRWSTEVCVNAMADTEDSLGALPRWIVMGAEDIPDAMAEASRRVKDAERRAVDLVEATLVVDRVGEDFSGVIVDREKRDVFSGMVMVSQPAILAPVRMVKPKGSGGEKTQRQGSEASDVSLRQKGRVQRLFAAAEKTRRWVARHIRRGGGLPLGERVLVRLEIVDVKERKLEFHYIPQV